jgi:hypothetical protein
VCGAETFSPLAAGLACVLVYSSVYNNGLWCSSSIVYPIADDGPTHPLYSGGFSMGIVRALLLISNYRNIIYVYAYVLCVCVCVRRFGGGSESGWTRSFPHSCH